MAKQCIPLRDCRTVQHLSGSVLLTLTANTLRGESTLQSWEVPGVKQEERRLHLVSFFSSPSPWFVSASTEVIRAHNKDKGDTISWQVWAMRTLISLNTNICYFLVPVIKNKNCIKVWKFISILLHG